VQFDDAFFYDFAEMASLAGIHYDFVEGHHARESISWSASFPRPGRA
jgi:hypothetical protein